MPTLLQQAIQQHQQGDAAAAVSLYRQVLQQEPHNLQAQHGLAIALTQLQQPEAALKELQLAIQQHPDQATLYNSLGNIYAAMQESQQALDAYQKALSISPSYSVALNNLGKCYYASERLQEADTCYQKALAENPDYIDALYNLALLHAKQDQNSKALPLLDRCLQKQPQHIAALGLKAEVCMQLEQTKQAIECYLARAELQPKVADNFHRLGQAYMQNQQPDEAIVAFEKAISLDDKHPECYHDLATAYLIKGDSAKALTYFFRQLEVRPLAQTYYNMGVLLLQQNRLHEAAQYLLYAAEHAPNYLPIHINLGGLYLKLGETEKGIVHYRKALELDDSNEEIKHIIAALTADKTPDKAPGEYIEHLFDQYANYYDKHLKHLEYKVPEKLRAAIREESGITSKQWRILDLGCGTGLSGQSFSDLATTLIGIDLSSQMVAAAKEKNIYHELHVMDVLEALNTFHDNNLIVAADVFTYIGNLDSIFSAAKNALAADGYFVFSVEAGHDQPYVLQQSVRYAHSKAYIEQLIESNGFTACRFDNLILRKQKGEPVQGYLVLLQRNHSL